MTNPSTSWFPKEELDSIFARVRAPASSKSRNNQPSMTPLTTVPPSMADSQDNALVVPHSETAETAEIASIHVYRQQSTVIMELARSKAMARGLLKEILQQITEKAAFALNATRAGVWTYDEKKTQLNCETLYLKNENRHEKGFTFEEDKYPEYFAALLTERALVVENALEDKRTIECKEDYLISNEIDSLLNVPFFIGGKMMGMLSIEQVNETRKWISHEEQFAASLSDFVALAFESSERKRAEEALLESEARLRLQGAALRRMTASKNLGAGKQEEALQEITETCAETLGVERCSVWLYKPDHSGIYCIELYQRSTNKHESGIELKAETYPRYFEAMRSERTIAAHDAHTDPRTSEFSEGYLTPLGIVSMLDVPIRVGGRMIGVVCIEHVGKPRKWLVEEEQFAGSLGDFVALAMEANERRQAQEELRQMLQMMKRFSSE